MASETIKVLNKNIDQTHKPTTEPQFTPSDKHKQVVSNIFHLFTVTAQNRNRNFEYFDGRNLIEFIDDSVRRFVTNIDERDGIEDWQARMHAPFTRNKIVAILGRAAAVLPKAEFFTVGDEDHRRVQIINDLYDYAENVDDSEELMFYALLEAGVKGTVIGYEGYEEQIRAVRDIEEYNDGVNIKLKEGKKILKRLKGTIVPLEDFYPASVSIRKIDDMPFCFWRSSDMNEAEFKMRFAQYPNAKYVMGRQHSYQDAERPFYADHISSDVEESKVEIIRYFNQDTDELVIIANGIWLNPLGNDEVMPIPFKHKKLPFWKSIYEPFGGDFFYGKSIADKLKSMQDVLNVLHNMFLDQGFLSIFAPILVSGQDDVEDDFLRPGRKIPVEDVNNFKQLEIQTGTGWHQFILNYTKDVLEQSSVDAVSQGVAGANSRVTATEIERAAQGVSAVLGLFHTFIKWAARDRARIKVKNILQFYTAPMIEQVLGGGGADETRKAFNTFKIEDTVLSSGKRGMKIIEMYRSGDLLPKKEDLARQTKSFEQKTGHKLEKIAITPEYIRDVEVDIRVIANPKTEMSKALNLALTLEKERTYMELIPDLLDREEAALRIATAFGDRPDKVLRRDLLETPPAQLPPPGVKPESAVMSQLISGATGGAKQGLALRDLAEQGA